MFVFYPTANCTRV